MVAAETKSAPRNDAAVNRPAGNGLLEGAASLEMFFLKRSRGSPWLDPCLVTDPLGAWAHPLVAPTVLSCGDSVVIGVHLAKTVKQLVSA